MADPHETTRSNDSTTDSLDATPAASEETAADVHDAMARVRQRLLDLTMRNRLLSFRLSKRAVPIVDELPRQTLECLVGQGRAMRLDPLARDDEPPPPEERDVGPRPARATATGDELPRADANETESTRTVEGEGRAESEAQPSSAPARAPSTDLETELPQDPGRGRESSPRHRDAALQTPYAYEELEKRLRGIQRAYIDAIQSTGVNLLHLACGFLEWYEDAESTTLRRAPLLLVPVAIERQRVELKADVPREEGKPPRKLYQYRYTIAYEGEDLTSNVSLGIKLQNEFGVDLPALSEFIPADGGVVDPEEYLEAVAEVLRGHPDAARWRVRREMVIGFFSFSKFRMYLDLDPRVWPAGKAPEENELLRDMLVGRQREPLELPTPEEIDRAQTSWELPLVLDADCSQTASLMAAMDGANLVIEGPPGTGKSQTITNLVGLALGAGKRVLFVSEKQAALDVVRRKLDAVGLGEYCLELHSHKARIGSLLDDLRRRLEFEPKASRRSHKLLETLEEHRRTLNDYAALVARVVGLRGETVEKIFWRARHYSEGLARSAKERGIDVAEVRVRLDAVRSPDLDADRLGEMEAQLDEVRRHVEDGILTRAACWKHFKPRLLVPEDRETIGAAIEEIEEIVGELYAPFERFVGDGLVPRDWTLASIERMLADDVLAARPSVDVVAGVAACVARDPDGAGRMVALAEELEAHRDAVRGIEERRERTRGVPEDVLRRYDEIATKLESARIEVGDAADIESALETVANARRAVVAFGRHVAVVARELSLTVPETLAAGLQLQRCAKALLSLDADALAAIEPRHADAEFVRALASARDRAKTLVAERAELEELFSLRDAPSNDGLRDLRLQLREAEGSFFRWLPFSKRAKLRRVIRRFCQRPDVVHRDDVPRLLERLSDFREREAEFSGDVALADRLGTLFRGTETRWETLDRVAALAEEAHALTDGSGVQRFLEGTRRAVEGRSRWANEREELERVEAALAAARSRFDSAIVGGAGWPTDTNYSAGAEWFGTLSSEIASYRDAFLPCALGDDSSFRELREEARARIEAYEEERAFAREAGVIAARLGPESGFAKELGAEFRGTETDPARIRSTLSWIEEIEGLALPSGWGEWILRSVHERFDRSIDAARAAMKLVAPWRAAVEKLLEFGDLRSAPGFDPGRSAAFDLSAPGVVSACRAGLPELLNWSRWCQARRRATELGLEALVGAAETGRVPTDRLRTALYAELYGERARRLLTEHPELEGFDRHHFERVQQDFSRKDQQWATASRRAIVEALGKIIPPEGVTTGRVGDYSELHLIRHEASKKRRHIPIRQLVERAASALMALKPCWLMSPLSVAQFLPPGEVMFDLVVMDEASQIRPEDALGAMARGVQVITVGDSKQMPPTRFFDQIDDDEAEPDEETALEQSESILDLCRGAYFSTMLEWHYRSEHESLIQFSNEAYYDGRLIPYPSIYDDHPRYGVKWSFVEGAYSRGRNVPEAEQVVAAVLEHAKAQLGESEKRRESLGVATMNIDQRDLVLDLLDRAAEEDEEADEALSALASMEDPLFVKNLENVQGDERDHILISCTYGPDAETGRVFQRFGPIGQRGGERRLNVLFTRARRRVTVISSLRGSDIRLTERSPRGVIDFRGYLEFAEGGGGSRSAERKREPSSALQRELAGAIERLGYEPVFQVGVASYSIDVAVVHPDEPGRFILGVECDSSSYSGTRVARDRERLRAQVLRHRGWRLHRVWAVDWYQNRDTEVARLEAAIREA